MKNIIFLFFFLLMTMLFNQFEPPVAIAACLGSGIVIAAIWHKVERLLLLREYANEIENIYIVSNHPTTNEEVDHELKMIQVKFSEVLIEVEEQKKLLKQSENELFADGQLEVLHFIFQDGQFVNETFSEFEERVIASIKEDRIARHSKLKSVNEEWYNQFSNYQQNVTFKK